MRLHRTRARGQRGATAVEFALVVPILLTLLFGIVEFGRYMWLQQAVSAASHEAARHAVGTNGSSGTVQYVDCDSIRDAARERAPDLTLVDSDIAVSYRRTTTPYGSCVGSPPTATSVLDGDRIGVTVSTQMDVNLLVFDAGLVISSTAERTIYPQGTS